MMHFRAPVVAFVRDINRLGTAKEVILCYKSTLAMRLSTSTWHSPLQEGTWQLHTSAGNVLIAPRKVQPWVVFLCRLAVPLALEP